jgi:branched-subunit amino acid permease
MKLYWSEENLFVYCSISRALLKITLLLKFRKILEEVGNFLDPKMMYILRFEVFMVVET